MTPHEMQHTAKGHTTSGGDSASHDRRVRSALFGLSTSALVVFAVLANPAFAQRAPGSDTGQTMEPSFKAYKSHVDWKNDRASEAVGNTSGPAYSIYRSHVAWRDGSVPVASVTRTGPESAIIESHRERR